MHRDSANPQPVSDAKLPVIYNTHRCACGESPLWHPRREKLFWVDVTRQQILSHDDGSTIFIQFSEFVTALAWIDRDHILAATESALTRVNIDTHAVTTICPLEQDKSETRSNDGRADPWGGFWISTMGKNAETNVGKIYRYFEGKIDILIDAITIPNGICFDKSRNRAYFADTAKQILYVLSLDSKTGHPNGSPQVFKDFSKTGDDIDGAVVDSLGQIWLGVWDGSKIITLNSDGEIIDTHPTLAYRPTCPAFGGEDYADLFITSAAIELEHTFESVQEQGRTLVLRGVTKGQAEPHVNIGKSF